MIEVIDPNMDATSGGDEGEGLNTQDGVYSFE